MQLICYNCVTNHTELNLAFDVKSLSLDLLYLGSRMILSTYFIENIKQRRGTDSSDQER